MKTNCTLPITKVIGGIPYRLALAGGWIDQPFISRLNPNPPGSMVVVGIEPTVRFMDRSGIATGTRKIALQRWKGKLPPRDPAALVKELYDAENQGKPEPSGSQDMIGLIYPGINRLDYDFAANGGVFPSHIESFNNARVARWLEKVIHIIPVAPRPEGYNPLGEKHLSSKWVARLGQSGKDCFKAICTTNLKALGASMNECMMCWEALLPHTVKHPTVTVDLKALLRFYQAQYPGAMYSGCGGGYLFIVSEKPVPGAFKVTVRLAKA
ncbi:MAG: hypothetical protein WCO56_20230 [Verrucomicrobiota bacterium]